MKKLMSKKAIKNAILIVSVALLLVAVTLGWFAHNTSASVNEFSAKIENAMIEYQLARYNDEDEAYEAINIDDIVLVPDNDNEYKYKLHIDNVHGDSFNAWLNLSVTNRVHEDDIRNFLQYSISLDGSSWTEYGEIKASRGELDLIEGCTDTAKDIYFKFKFPGVFENESGVVKYDHNNLSKQELKLELFVLTESDEDIEE